MKVSKKNLKRVLSLIVSVVFIFSLVGVSADIAIPADPVVIPCVRERKEPR